MPIDPLSAFILGTCCCICLPCLLPCCLSLPVIPLPMILIREQQYPTAQYMEVGDNPRTRGNFPYHGFQCFNGQRYNVVMTKDGILFQKANRPL